MFALSLDGTEMGRGSKRKAIPVYLSLLNLKLKTLVSKFGTDIVGFIPEFPLSDKKIFEYMRQAGIRLKGNQKKSLSCLKQWLIQICLKNIFRVIYEMNEKGPVQMMIGKDGHVHDVMVCYAGVHGKCINFIFA